jgi:hypothetical protein
MKIAHPSFRTIVLVGSLLVLASTTAVVLAAAQTQGSCPSIIASLFPKDASIRAGQYFPGDMGMGDGSADLSFENPSCAKQKYSAHISVAVKYYGGEMAVLIKSKESPYGTIDRDADKEQTIKDATSELAQTKITPKIEKVGIGEIVYVERKSECPPEGPAAYAARVGPMIVPNVKLKGVAWTDNARLQVTLDGRISVDLAKAAVAEVFTNLQKADFSKAK